MCLYLRSKDKNKIPEISEEDKTVYKVFSCYTTTDGKLIIRSPYRDYTYEKKENVADDFEYSVNDIAVLIGFHSFERIEDAIILQNYFNRVEREFSKNSATRTYFIVLECVVPKGTPYYVGEFPHNAYVSQPTCICSEKIIVKDQFVMFGKTFEDSPNLNSNFFSNYCEIKLK